VSIFIFNGRIACQQGLVFVLQIVNKRSGEGCGTTTATCWRGLEVLFALKAFRDCCAWRSANNLHSKVCFLSHGHFLIMILFAQHFYVNGIQQCLDFPELFIFHDFHDFLDGKVDFHPELLAACSAVYKGFSCNPAMEKLLEIVKTANGS